MSQHLPEQWKKMAHLFDLPDYLTWRATGSLTRCVCVCMFVCVCMWVGGCMRVCVYIYIYMYVCVYVCMHVCV